MNTRYTSKHVQSLFGISHEAVRQWTSTFAEFLSPSATPPPGAARVFQDDDLRVFALVSEFKQRGLTHADAHLALKAGQRGDLPNPTALDKLPPVVQDMIVRMRNEMDDTRQQLKAAETDRDKERGKVELLEKMLADAHRRIEELIRGARE